MAQVIDSFVAEHSQSSANVPPDKRLYEAPPLISEIVVNASFADNGAARRRAFGVKLVLLGAAVTAVPLGGVALLKAILRRPTA